jgi:hypothetical protein
MKYSELIPTSVTMKPLGVRADQAGLLVGAPGLFAKMVDAGWIRPVVAHHKEKIFAVTDIEAAFARLQGGDYPECRD